nr:MULTISPECIES: WG repeat-containing protein [unclassified Paenibacillus]
MGVIDRQGNLIIDDLFLDTNKLFRVYIFSEGLARYQNKQGEWVYLDKYGKEVIKTSYDEVLNFREGLAAVRKNGKWGFIDRKGKEVVQPHYDEIRDDDGYGISVETAGFYDGLSAVNKNGKWGFIDKSGKEVIPLKYDWVNNFHEELAVVSKNEKWG